MVLGSLFAILRKSQGDALRKAASQGDGQRVRQLLKGGAPADPKKQHHTSALQLAAKSGCVDCVKALIEAGAGVDRVSDGSPLLDAAALGHLAVVKLLLESKADPAVAVGGNTAFHMAARFGRVEVLRVLASGADLAQLLPAANQDGKTPLMLACMQQAGGEEAVAFLLGAGADPAAADKALNTPLHLAATAGNLPLVKLLLAAGAPITANSKGRTPLHLAAVFGHDRIVELLAQQQDNVTAADEEGSTALHMVTKGAMSDPGSRRSMVRMVVGAGVDPDARDKAGHTAADYADSDDLKQLLGSLRLAEAAPEDAGDAAAPTPVAAAAQLAASMDGACCSSAGSSAFNSVYGAIAGPAEAPPPAANATSKAEKMAAIVAASLAAAPASEGGGANCWAAKEAMRRHTSEQQEWTLKTADDSPAAAVDADMEHAVGS